MKRSIRWAAVVSLFLAPLAGLTYAYPHWPEAASLDVWDAPALGAEIDQCQQRRDDLNRRVQLCQDRLARKLEITTDVIAGRMNLAEAAREFRRLNVTNPDFVRCMRYKYPDCPEDELHVHNLIDTVDRFLEQQPEHDRLLARLNAEYKLMRCDGSIHLD